MKHLWIRDGEQTLRNRPIVRGTVSKFHVNAIDVVERLLPEVITDVRIQPRVVIIDRICELIEVHLRIENFRAIAKGRTNIHHALALHLTNGVDIGQVEFG